MHERFPDHDAAIRAWFDAQGWPVTRIHYDFDRNLLAWRHESRPNRTLYIPVNVLEDTPAHVLVAAFGPMSVAAHVSRDENVKVQLVKAAAGGVAVVQRSEV